MSLAESLERAASEMAALADQIRPANGDPHRLLDTLDADEAARVLAWLLREETDSAAEVVQVWGELEEAAPVLLAVDESDLPKAARKLLRKTRHRLRSRGVEAPERDAAPATGRRAGRTSDRWEAAHVSMPDFRGARVGYLVEAHPAGGARMFEIRFDEARGILDFKLYNAGRSKVRGFLRSLTAGTGHRLFEVGRDPLRALVRRASLAQPMDRPLPTAFVEWRSRLFPEELDTAETPGDQVRAALGGADSSSEGAVDFEGTLADVREGRLGPWPPRTSWVGEWMQKGRDSAEGLEGEARAEAIESWIEEASEALEKETDASMLARHLDEMAWIQWRSDDEASARTLLAAADAMRRGGEMTKRMSRARVEGLFAPFLTELRVVEVDGQG